mgnify:CR=1 FL=1
MTNEITNIRNLMLTFDYISVLKLALKTLSKFFVKLLTTSSICTSPPKAFSLLHSGCSKSLKPSSSPLRPSGSLHRNDLQRYSSYCPSSKARMHSERASLRSASSLGSLSALQPQHRLSGFWQYARATVDAHGTTSAHGSVMWSSTQIGRS